MAQRLDYEAEYNARAAVPEHEEIRAGWIARSEAFRNSRGEKAQLDLSYGEFDRQKFDLFLPDEDPDTAPLIVYIHGGYWQRGHHTEYALIGETFTKAGFRVAVPSYRICPDVAVAHIVGDIQEFLASLYDRIPRRPLVIGHSAGGHLAAMALATDWSDVDGVPNDLVTHAISISGIFDLQPLLKTSANQVLCLTPETAEAVSPLSGSAPPPGRHFVAAVGAKESPEFIRQSLEIAGRWGEAGVTTECVLVPNANHFTILDELMKPGSGLYQRVIALAAAVDAGSGVDKPGRKENSAETAEAPPGESETQQEAAASDQAAS